jgi:ferredoxin-NADP reductase
VRRETWWLVHLYLYLALAISFAHVIVLGPSFVGHPLTRAVWSAAWLATAGLVLCYRFGLPILRSARHRLHVVEVRREGPDVTSVIVGGRHLDRLAVSGGQFFFWRFLTRDMWWQAHPYSLSALPRPPYLRLTVKAVGDHSAALARLRPGTRIAVEGPYGAFTRHAQQRPGALLVAAGIGVTALRSLLEDLPPGCAPVVILRAAREADLVLRAEVSELVRNRRGRLHELIGSRDRAPIDEQSLLSLVPDLARRDVFVCGPEGFVTDIADIAANLGVPVKPSTTRRSRCDPAGLRGQVTAPDDTSGTRQLSSPRGVLPLGSGERAHEAGATVRHRRHHRRIRGGPFVPHPARGTGGTARGRQPPGGRRAAGQAGQRGAGQCPCRSGRRRPDRGGRHRAVRLRRPRRQGHRQR